MKVDDDISDLTSVFLCVSGNSRYPGVIERKQRHIFLFCFRDRGEYISM